MSWPFRNSPAVTELSPRVAALLRGDLPGADGVAAEATGTRVASPAAPLLPGTFKAQLLAAYERRGGAPSSGLRSALRGIRWPVAALSAAAAAVVVVLAGAPSGGDAVSGRSPLAGALTSARGISTGRVPAIRPPAAAAGLANAGRSSNPVPADSSAKIGEREVAFLGGEWEHVHPLPSTAAKVRVVVDQDLPLIGVGWTPDLDGP